MQNIFKRPYIQIVYSAHEFSCAQLVSGKFKTPAVFMQTRAQYIEQTVRTQLLFRFGTFNSVLAGRNVEIKFTVHFALPKRPINQFQPVWQSRQQVLRAYCPNIYTVDQRQSGIISKSGQAPFWSFENFFMTANLAPFFSDNSCTF